MTIDKCPHCNVQIIYQPHIGDYIHSCNSTVAALDEDDVVNFHTSFKNNENITTNQQGGAVLEKGIINKNLSIEPGAIRQDVEDYTARGNRASTHRQRAHYEYIIVR